MEKLNDGRLRDLTLLDNEALRGILEKISPIGDSSIGVQVSGTLVTLPAKHEKKLKKLIRRRIAIAKINGDIRFGEYKKIDFP